MTVINFASRSGAQDFMEELRARKLYARLWNRDEEGPSRCERYCVGGFLKATCKPQAPPRIARKAAIDWTTRSCWASLSSGKTGRESTSLLAFSATGRAPGL